MMLHQDGSTHEWVPNCQWDLIVTLDDATNERYSAFFVEEEGTMSSFQGLREVIEAKGLFSSLYVDRGSHYWYTAEAGGKVDKTRLTQVHRALQQLGITLIAAYSPEARGRSERVFRTLQDRLPKELALAGITDMAVANQYLIEQFLPVYNRRFAVSAVDAGTAFVPWIGPNLAEILCVQEERVVANDNTVRYHGQSLQIPPDSHRFHYVKATVRVHEHPEGTLARRSSGNCARKNFGAALKFLEKEHRTDHGLHPPDNLTCYLTQPPMSSANRRNPLTRCRTSENRCISAYSTVESHAYRSPTTNSLDGCDRRDLVRSSLGLDRRHLGSDHLGCAADRSQPSSPCVEIFQSIETERDGRLPCSRDRP
jgi:hypothetical protein